jgi:multicomponent K+:H+ antiporter subunit A
MRLILIVLLPFLGALLPMLLARAGRRVCTLGTAVFTLTALTLLLTCAAEVLEGSEVAEGWDWIPQIGMNFEFRIDGLGLLMAGLILGIGLLIIIYARYYLYEKEPIGQFFTYLLVFQGAMVGIALSDNLLVLLVFWELTSLASFLLIGFWRHLAEGRQGARMALLVTGAGGLCLTAGLILLGRVAGSYNIQEVLQQAELVQGSPLYPLILSLICLGCFTKSAQFPFHFWLPRAMAAPTPVSAYLHSATMVKAGVFLLARLWPVLSGTEWWFYLVVGVGTLTMLYGSIIALFKTDLKGMLAYSTISHLGMMTMLLGLGTQAGVIAALFHLLNHSLFKASLFMNVGIIDHGTGTRDLNRLGGLLTWMPLTALMALLALAANAGLPPLNGFISKELMLEEVWETPFAGYDSLLALLAVVAGAFAVAYSFRYFVKVYLGRADKLDQEPQGPEFGLGFPPGLLAIGALLVGIFPGYLAEPLIQSAVQAVTVAAERPNFHFHLWHGWNIAVYSSLAAVMLGMFLFLSYPLLNRLFQLCYRLDGQRLFEGLASVLVRVCAGITQQLQRGNLPGYLAWMLATMLGLSACVFATSDFQLGSRPLLPVNFLSVTLVAILSAAALATAVFHRQRLLAFIAANVVGLIFCIAFVYLSAPDLALTQMAVEVVTLILILLAMFFLPTTTPRESSVWRVLRDVGLSLTAGVAMAGLTWMMLRNDRVSPLAAYFIEQSKPAGGGSNIVNVILVDFRGFDTFNEIAVLGIAALVIYALLDGAMHGPAKNKLDTWCPQFQRVTEHHPKMLMIPTRVLLPTALLVGSYMFLRGHNEPGGGFVAGLVITIGMIVQYMVSGFRWSAERISIDAHAWIGTGILLAAATGTAAMVIGDPFLKNYHTYVPIPYLGKIGLSSALFFDAGVLMVVVGAMMLTLGNLARLGRRAERAAELAERAERQRLAATAVESGPVSAPGEEA